MPTKKPRPVTDTDRDQLRALHAEGLGRNEIARRMGRSPRTISVLAQELGLDFDRTHTAVATEARKVDAKARRAAIIEGLYDVVEDDLAYLKQDGDYAMAEVSMGDVVRYGLDRLPAQDRKALIGGISTATTAAARIEAIDADQGAGEVGLLLGTLFDRLRDRHGDA